ncbi:MULTISPECIES: DUF4197 domain-containing protein [unclassified Neptuniibacter]|uniref:DUF4197 domain-containing protein n=1 Tax=unclassified Neptuniibacter TaxID=2630693 RepID=UPI0026E45ACE|nr:MULTISPECIES: DUF4197 domain-containing protein [unclassified Neptuniibacter]MDO6513230.1 DUF4197 domain-containing protein [Neptuniibacter sp. 2_MG-2023]MDO6592358.1 DUF4197 domain-containing protein [Neptuniibacter sp. 1_MG-2023]
MKKSYLITSILAASITSATAYAGWADMLKEAVQDEEVQQKVLDTATGSNTTSSTSGQATDLSTETVINGLKEALEVGSRRAIEEISQPGGYLDNQDIRIPLPDGINKVASLLKKYGLESQVTEFEESMNRAAEKAAPQATELIVSAVKEMSFDDAKKIYSGSDDAATQYFKEKTSGKLRELFQPTVEESLGQVGATRYYNDLASEAKEIPFVGDKVNVDLDNYVTEEALNGLFTMLAVEEKKIRENPAARTTDLLKQLFQ